MPARLAEADQMTVEEFLGFTASRPDGERWELIEGRAIMNPAPTQWHQIITANIVAQMLKEKATQGAQWTPLLGVGTRVPISPRSLPQPDVMAIEGAPIDSPVAEQALILVEVLSRSNSKADQAWRRRVYASVPNCRHYVTVDIKTARVVRYDRETGWGPHEFNGLGAVLELPGIATAIPLTDIYRWTPIE